MLNKQLNYFAISSLWCHNQPRFFPVIFLVNVYVIVLQEDLHFFCITEVKVGVYVCFSWACFCFLRWISGACFCLFRDIFRLCMLSVLYRNTYWLYYPMEFTACSLLAIVSNHTTHNVWFLMIMSPDHPQTHRPSAQPSLSAPVSPQRRRIFWKIAF